MHFPKTYVHRDNHAAQVVVANQQQEAELPADFVPLDGSPSGSTGASPGDQKTGDKADSAIKDASGAENAIATGLADLEDRRAAFDKATDDFAKHVRDTEAELAATREQLDVEAEKIANERKQLDTDRAYFEQEKATATVTMDGGDVADTTADAPAKRSRKASAAEE